MYPLHRLCLSYMINIILVLFLANNIEIRDLFKWSVFKSINPIYERLRAKKGQKGIQCIVINEQ